MLNRPSLCVVVALAAGVALGLAGRASDYLGPEVRFLFALGAPWFVVAFGVGAVVRRPLPGAAAGALLFLARGRAGEAGWVLACQLAVGAGLLLVASRPPRARLVALGATVAVLAASADGALRMLLRARGWGG